MQVQIKRIYESKAPEDGTRILVDRLWPRGLSKEKAHIDLWLKDIAPSPALRKWFNHDPRKWNTFQERYIQELGSNNASLKVLKAEVKKGKVTLLFAAKDEQCNNARVLQNLLKT